MKYSGNTSNMRSHLKLLHPHEYTALLKEEEGKKETSKSCSSQLSISVSSTRGQPLDRSSPRWMEY